MQEVTVRLQFTRECLGSARKSTGRDQVVFSMLRDCRGHVLFLPTWWQSLMRYAAHAIGRHQQLVDKINWDPRVDGRVVLLQRRVVRLRKDGSIKREGYALHEGFPANSIIGISAILPDGMTVDWFQRLLSTIGRYRGISPFQMEDPYGTFEVVSVRRAVYDGDVRSETDEVVEDADSRAEVRHDH